VFDANLRDNVRGRFGNALKNIVPHLKKSHRV